MWLRNTVLLFLISSVLFSCNSGSGGSPRSTGRGSEIIVVAKKVIWDGAVGDTIRTVLMQQMEGLPEAEPEFTLIFIPEESFSKYLQTHRNILFVDVNPELKRNIVETLKNEWSHPQRVVKIRADSDSACIYLFAKHAVALKELFNQSEFAYCRALIAMNRNMEAEKILADKFGIEMNIPNDFIIAKRAADFIWLRTETDTISNGVFIYTMTYKDTSQLAPAAVLDTRDRFTKRIIPGASGGAHIMIQRESKPPVSHQIIFKGMYALETRGLWHTQGDFMGGPFINYTIVDAPRQRLIVFDGYVYYPNKSKRNYMRQLESIIWGAGFGKPTKGN